MSKIKKDYEHTFFGKLERWIAGENDVFYEEPEPIALEEREKKAGHNYLGNVHDSLLHHQPTCSRYV